MHKDYLPDVTGPDNNDSDYDPEEEEEETADVEEEYDDYQDNLHHID